MSCVIIVNTELSGLQLAERLAVIRGKIAFLCSRTDVPPPFEIRIESLKLEDKIEKPTIAYALSPHEIEEIEKAAIKLPGVSRVERKIIREVIPIPQIVLILSIDCDDSDGSLVH